MTPEWEVRPCPPIGSSFIACATMHGLVRSQHFSCPLMLILQEHQGDHFSNMDLIFWYFAKKTNRNDQSYFPLRSKHSIFNQRRRSFQSQQSNCECRFTFSSSKAGKFRFHINEWIHVGSWLVQNPHNIGSLASKIFFESIRHSVHWGRDAFDLIASRNNIKTSRRNKFKTHMPNSCLILSTPLIMNFGIKRERESPNYLLCLN